MKTKTRRKRTRPAALIKAVITWANPDRLHCPLTALSSVYTPHFVLPADAEGYNAIRWEVEQAYLRCESAEITDPWEISKLVLAAIGIKPRAPQPNTHQRHDPEKLLSRILIYDH